MISFLENTKISIHVLREEGDDGPQGQGHIVHGISIHALREEGDTSWKVYVYKDQQFLSTPSARRATSNSVCITRDTGHFYPRPPRGGRRDAAGVLPWNVRISIHALREEGDGDYLQKWGLYSKFLSTPSTRRATAKTGRKYSAFVSLYTALHKLQRGLCKASRKTTPLLAQSTVIPVRSTPENHVHCLFALAGHLQVVVRRVHQWNLSQCTPSGRVSATVTV